MRRAPIPYRRTRKAWRDAPTQRVKHTRRSDAEAVATRLSVL